MVLRQKDLIDNESIVLEVREHAKKMIVPFLLFLALVAVVVVTWLFSSNDVVKWIVVGICVVLAIIGVFVPWLKWRTTSFTITTQRIAERGGIFTRVGRDIPLYRVNTVSMEKDLIDRIFRCGTLVVADASEKPGLTMRDVPRVEAVQKTLHELIWSTDDGPGQGPGGPPGARGPGRAPGV